VPDDRLKPAGDVVVEKGHDHEFQAPPVVRQLQFRPYLVSLPVEPLVSGPRQPVDDGRLTGLQLGQEPRGGAQHRRDGGLLRAQCEDGGHAETLRVGST